MRPFLLTACLLLPSFCYAQCGPGGCSTAGGLMGGWYSAPTYQYSQPVQYSQRSVTYTSPSYTTSSASSSNSGYTVSDNGSIIAPDGGTVTKLGGVEIVAKSYATSLSNQQARSESGSSGQCQCGPDLAIMNATLMAMSKKLDSIEDKLAYREKQSAKPTADAALARLEQLRARQVNESLALK